MQYTYIFTYTYIYIYISCISASSTLPFVQGIKCRTLSWRVAAARSALTSRSNPAPSATSRKSHWGRSTRGLSLRGIKKGVDQQVFFCGCCCSCCCSSCCSCCGCCVCLLLLAEPMIVWDRMGFHPEDSDRLLWKINWTKYQFRVRFMSVKMNGTWNPPRNEKETHLN